MRGSNIISNSSSLCVQHTRNHLSSNHRTAFFQSEFHLKLKKHQVFVVYQDSTCPCFCPACLECMTDHKCRRLKLQRLLYDCEFLILLLKMFAPYLNSEFPNTHLIPHVPHRFLPSFSSGFPMGATKSKPKDPGQRSRSLDGTIGLGSSSGHHFSSGPRTQTPDQSPAVGTGRRSNMYHTNVAEHQLFGGADHTASVTSPIRGMACD